MKMKCDLVLILQITLSCSRSRLSRLCLCEVIKPGTTVERSSETQFVLNNESSCECDGDENQDAVIVKGFSPIAGARLIQLLNLVTHGYQIQMFCRISGQNRVLF